MLIPPWTAAMSAEPAGVVSPPPAAVFAGVTRSGAACDADAAALLAGRDTGS
jgi:hypothetical protein